MKLSGFLAETNTFSPESPARRFLNFFHWLGALISNATIIGVKGTPVRAVVDRAAQMIPIDRKAITFVVALDGSLHGLFYGAPEPAWDAAADLSNLVSHQAGEAAVQTNSFLCAADVR